MPVMAEFPHFPLPVKSQMLGQPDRGGKVAPHKALQPDDAFLRRQIVQDVPYRAKRLLGVCQQGLPPKDRP